MRRKMENKLWTARMGRKMMGKMIRVVWKTVAR
jgi:hypothetical protein